MILQLFKAILLTSAVGSLTAAALMLLRPVTKRYFGPVWQYYVWLAVLIAMTLPITVKLPESKIQPVSEHGDIQTAAMPETGLPEESPVRAPRQNENTAAKENIGGFDVQQALNEDPTVNIPEIICYIWLGGAAVFLGGGILSYWLFLGRIKKHSVGINCLELIQAAEEMGIKRKINVYATDVISAPLMTGVFKPVLILPEHGLTIDGLHYVLLHELTHYKRHDLWYKWFAMLINAVHWFNPLMYLIIKQINEECEISCDLAVTKNMTEEEKKRYMQTILAFMIKKKPAQNV